MCPGGGDFLSRPQRAPKAYVSSASFHDWNDETCVRILRSCREAHGEGGRVLVLDTIIPRATHGGKVLDVMMLASLPGREPAGGLQALRSGGAEALRAAPAQRLSITEAVAA